MRALSRVLRVFFQAFYHQLAWTYDFVAAAVSIGRWNKWIRAILPFLNGDSILELGFGTGQLQDTMLANTRLKVVGLDESAQMATLARRRLKRAGHPDIKLTRGLAQWLPFSGEAFDTVVSTFPTKYVFDELTLREVHRVLDDDGRLVVLPAAWIVGKGVVDRGAAWLFKITHQAPRSADALLIDSLQRPLEHAGFEAEFRKMDIDSSTLLVIIARKSAGSSASPVRGATSSAAQERHIRPMTESRLA